MKTPAHPLLRCCGLLLAVACWPSLVPLAAAQETSPPESIPQQPVPQAAAPQSAESAADITSAPGTFTLRADTELHLRMIDAVASNTHKRLDRFKLELVEPITFEGREIVPVGAIAEGEVVHSAKSGMAGKPGELILVTRLLRVGDQQIKLRSFSAGTGKDRYNLANGLIITLGLPGLFFSGKNITVPSGTDVYAKVANDHVLPISAPPSMSSTPTESQPPNPQPTEETNQNENTPH